MHASSSPFEYVLCAEAQELIIGVWLQALQMAGAPVLLKP
jgi:hypothetical protein